MKRKEIPNRTRKVTIRLQLTEYEELSQKFKTTTCRKFSEYIRDILLNKPIQVYYRNQSADEFLSVSLRLKSELITICQTQNQVVKKLHLLQDKKNLQGWITEQDAIQKRLQEKIKEISFRMDQIYQQWLQK